MTLYISNPTTQTWNFHYRTPDNNLLAMVEIPRGRQVSVGQGWNGAQTERVVRQLQKMGAREAIDTHGKMGAFSGLLYRVDSQIETDEILAGNVAVVDTSQDRSVTQTTRAALAFDRNANESGRGRRLARTTQVEVEQQIEPGTRPTGKEMRFDLAVDPDAPRDVRLPV